MSGKPQPLEPRFWQKVRKTEGCWEWVGYRTNNPSGPRGQFYFQGKHWLAHRVSWVMHNGPIPPGLFVCHTCDNPLCVRPDHLFLGTNSDNIRDCVNKGRMYLQKFPERSNLRNGSGFKINRPRGEANGAARLTASDVVKIKTLLARGAMLKKDIAEQFGVNAGTISAIVVGKTWKHVLPAPDVVEAPEKSQ